MEKAIQEALQTSKLLMKDVLFPEARALTDIFDAATVIKDLATYKSTTAYEWALEPKGVCKLSSFCSVDFGDQYMGFDVKANRLVVDTVGQHMLLSDGYVLNFSIVVRENGIGLITIKYDRILGDRWVAFIDAQTIPREGSIYAPTRNEQRLMPATYNRDPDLPIITHQLLRRIERKYFVVPDQLREGKYMMYEPKCFVGKWARVALDSASGKEWVWVDIYKTITEGHNTLAGKLANQPTQSKDFSLHDDVAIHHSEIGDLMSITGQALNLNPLIEEQLGPDFVHSFMREFELNLPFQMAHAIWFSMSDLEKETVWRAYQQRAKTQL
jgi:hypothetical protein